MHLISTGLIGALAVSTGASANQCPAPRFVYEPDAYESTPGEQVVAQSDSLSSEDGSVTLSGNTTIRYQGRELSAENAQYNPETGEVSVAGSLRFQGEGFQLRSDEAYIDMDDDVFRTGESVYELDLEGKRATGKATGMQRLPNGHFIMEGATYSTCPPGDLSWFVQAEKIDLDVDEGIGIARDLKLVFKGVPLMALPVFSFPISDKRKTGFLAPILARGDETGFELHLPWYWNIRPDLDATFTPRYMSRRGLQLQSEIRYLNRQGHWKLDHEYLKDRELNNDARYLTQLLHEGNFNAELSSTIVAQRVSDDEYLEDLGDSLQVASISHLEQRAELNYDKDNVQSLLRLQSFQTIDEDISPEDRPHRRLPQFTLNAESERMPYGFKADIEGEFVYFDKEDAVTGARIDVRPRLSLPISGDAWFIKPSVSHRFTYYDLNNTDLDTSENTIDSTNSRNISSLSIDSGLFFDRLVDDAGSIQTLEPRLFYLRVPFEDQSDIPIFDSSAFDFNFSQLFRDNRFSGADRVADADQVSAALTTRMIDGKNGRERFSASIGQTFFLADRRVSLESDDTIDTRDTSDFVGEVTANIDSNWSGHGRIRWNPDDENTVRSSISLSYQPARDQIFNVSHRVVDGLVLDEKSEQIDLSAYWNLGSSWRVAGRWNYALDADRSIETLLGLEYDSCCWGVRFAARRYIADNGEDHDTSLYFQLVLKGLAPLGQNYGALLENAITGYQDILE